MITDYKSKLTREEKLSMIKRAGFHFQDEGEHKEGVCHTLPLEYSEHCFHRLIDAIEKSMTKPPEFIRVPEVEPNTCTGCFYFRSPGYSALCSKGEYAYRECMNTRTILIKK